MRNFIICTSDISCISIITWKGGRSRAYNTHGGDGDYMQNVNRRDHLGDKSMNCRIIIKWMLKGECVKVLTEFVWLRIRLVVACCDCVIWFSCQLICLFVNLYIGWLVSPVVSLKIFPQSYAFYSVKSEDNREWWAGKDV